LVKRICPEPSRGRSRLFGGAVESEVGKGNRVELVFGKPSPVLEGIGRTGSGERHPPGADATWIDTFASRPSAPAGSGDGNIVVTHGSACPEGQRIQRGRENTGRGRWSDGVGSSLLETAQKTAALRGLRGDPELVVSSMWCSSAHSQRRARSPCRGDGGDTIGSDLMWVIGRVQSVVAYATGGVGACVEAAGQGRRAERASFGSRGPQSDPARSVVEASACCSAPGVATRSWHRESTPGSGILSTDTREVASAREALRGFRGASSGANRVAMRNQSARSAFRRYPESLVWLGRWGSRRGGDAAAGFQPDPTSAGRFRAVNRKR
jgi:hypothetical protein